MKFFHIRAFYKFICIHTVNVHALASSSDNTLAQTKGFYLFANGEGFGISVIQGNTMAIEKNGHVISLIKKNIAKTDGIPFEFWIVAVHYKKHVHACLAWLG